MRFLLDYLPYSVAELINKGQTHKAGFLGSCGQSTYGRQAAENGINSFENYRLLRLIILNLQNRCHLLILHIRLPDFISCA